MRLENYPEYSNTSVVGLTETWLTEDHPKEVGQYNKCEDEIDPEKKLFCWVCHAHLPNDLFSMHRIHFLVFQNLTWGVIPPVTGSVFWSLGMIPCPGYPGCYTFHCLDNITSESFLNPSDSST